MTALSVIARWVRTSVAVPLAAVMVAGCGALTGSAGATTGPTATTTGLAATAAPTASPSAVTANPTPPIVHAGGAADLVLRMASGGGLLPTELRLGEMPDVSVYGDGSVILATAAGLRPEDPLLPTITAARLTPAGLERVLGAAGEAGIIGVSQRYGLDDVYDL